MAWTIRFHPDAARELRKLGREAAARIVRTLETRIAPLDDPRTLGAPLKGGHEGYWRWRIGDYRVIAHIEAERITILVVRVAHRARSIAKAVPARAPSSPSRPSSRLCVFA